MLPPSFRLFVRRMVFFPADFYNSITGKKENLVPPRGMIYTGSGDYVKTGNLFLKFFIEHCNLLPNNKVLDIGSGIGRIARPLTSYLLPDGSYEGFDLVDSGVNWCKKNISKQFPNFNFQKVNLYNDLYTSKGENAEKFVFPYNDEEFDLVFLVSVFTHMLPDEVDNYMKEIHRVLKKGGKCLATFFVINNNSLSLSKSNKFRFDISFGNYYLMDEKVQSANVAFKEEFIVDKLIAQNSLTLNKIIYGYWASGKVSDKISFQDVVIIEK